MAARRGRSSSRCFPPRGTWSVESTESGAPSGRARWGTSLPHTTSSSGRTWPSSFSFAPPGRKQSAFYAKHKRRSRCKASTSCACTTWASSPNGTPYLVMELLEGTYPPYTEAPRKNGRTRSASRNHRRDACPPLRIGQTCHRATTRNEEQNAAAPERLRSRSQQCSDHRVGAPSWWLLPFIRRPDRPARRTARRTPTRSLFGVSSSGASTATPKH